MQENNKLIIIIKLSIYHSINYIRVHISSFLFDNVFVCKSNVTYCCWAIIHSALILRYPLVLSKNAPLGQLFKNFNHRFSASTVFRKLKTLLFVLDIIHLSLVVDVIHSLGMMCAYKTLPLPDSRSLI